MAAEDDAPIVAPVRELEEIDPGMLPQVDELRQQVIREQRSRNRRRGWVIAAGLVVVAGAAALLLPKLASQQKIDVATLNVPAGPTEAEINAEKKADELATQHAELSRRILDLDSRAAAQWGGADFAAARKSLDEIGGMLERRKYEPAVAPAAALDKAADRNRSAGAGGAGRADLRRQTRAECRRIRECAPGLPDGAQDRTGQQRGNRRPRQGRCRERRGADARRCRERRERQGLAQGAGAVRRRAQAQSRQCAGHRGPGARAARDGGGRIQCHDGRGPRRVERRAPLRSPHPSREGAPHAPGQPGSRCRSAARGGYRLGPQPRGTRTARRAPGQRGTLDRGAGHLRRGTGARSIPAVRHRRAARPSHRARNSASVCRHSSTGRSGSPKTRCVSRRSACWRGPRPCPARGR